MTFRALPVALSLLAAACGGAPAPRPPRLLGPGGEIPLPTFTAEEEAKDVAVKLLRRTEQASYHIVRLRRAEPPHTHEHSELSVTVLSGSVRMHLGDQVLPLGPGDIVDIPRGSPHFAENVGTEPAYAHAVFSPALRPDDRRSLPTPLPR